MRSWAKKGCAFLALGGLLIAWSGWPAGPPVTVQLYDLVYIAGGRVILGDIADLKGDPQAIDQLRNLQIGSTLGRTESRIVTIEEIRRALPAAVEVYFSGAPAVEVRPQTLTGQFCDFAPAIGRRFASLAADSIETTISNVRCSEQLDAGSRLPVQFSIISNNTLVPGTQVVSLERRDASQEISRHHCQIDLNLYARLAFAARRIQRGQTIKPEDLVIRTADLKSTGMSGLVYQPARVAGWEAARNIAPNTPLRWDHLHPPAAVRKGDTIELVMELNNVQVRATATALETGAPGEIIWVRLDDSGKRVRARVLKGGCVVPEEFFFAGARHSP